MLILNMHWYIFLYWDLWECLWTHRFLKSSIYLWKNILLLTLGIVSNLKVKCKYTINAKLWSDTYEKDVDMLRNISIVRTDIPHDRVTNIKCTNLKVCEIFTLSHVRLGCILNLAFSGVHLSFSRNRMPEYFSDNLQVEELQWIH